VGGVKIINFQQINQPSAWSVSADFGGRAMHAPTKSNLKFIKHSYLMQKFCGLALEGGGFGGLRRSRKEFKSDETLFFVGFAALSRCARQLPQSASLTAPPWEEPTLKTSFCKLFTKPLSRLRRQLPYNGSQWFSAPNEKCAVCKINQMYFVERFFR